MSKHYFFYDESEHSRKISRKTVSSLNYYDNFIAMIVGWTDVKDDILQRYSDFESCYVDRKDRNGEIKSTMLSQKQFQYGFASLNKQNAQFLNDFLSLFLWLLTMIYSSSVITFSEKPSLTAFSVTALYHRPSEHQHHCFTLHVAHVTATVVHVHG